MVDVYWSVLKEALLESLYTLPVLLLAYYLIEFIEYKWSAKLQNNQYLKCKAGPVLASLLGSIPQCGFSVISSDLFAKRMISVGALLAVFIATSDEALPIMIAHPQSILSLLLLVGLKIVIAIVIGYLANRIYRLLFKTVPAPQPVTVEPELTTHNGCCHHHVETKKFDWLHPLLHCLKILVFILVLNILFGCLTDIWVGEENLMTFLTQSKWWQPVLAILVGLIPNCATSVVLTELYLMGGLQFSALLAGLCVNAGLGVIFMFKQNHRWRENLFVMVILLLTGLAVGYGLIWIPAV